MRSFERSRTEFGNETATQVAERQPTHGTKSTGLSYISRLLVLYWMAKHFFFVIVGFFRPVVEGGSVCLVRQLTVIGQSWRFGQLKMIKTFQTLVETRLI